MASTITTGNASAVESIGVGVIGLGYTGRLHLAGYESLGSGTRVRALLDSDENKAAMAGECGAKFYRDLDAMLDDPAVDAVSICLPTAAHYAAALQALRRGRHVLVEKPAACTKEEVEHLMAAADESNCVFMVGMTHRFYPEMQMAWDLYTNGAIGTALCCRDSIIEHPGMLNLPPWYLDPKQAGGGVVMTSGIHLVDRLLWFLDDSVTECSGYCRNRLLGKAVEDEAMMQLTFSRGAVAQIILSWLPYPHPVVCDLDLYGTRGSLHVHTWQGLELMTDQGSNHWDCYSPGADHVSKVQIGINAEINEFVASIREGRQPRPSAKDAFAAFVVVRDFLDQTPIAG